MLKTGNGVHLRHDGSILMGERDVPGSLISSREAFERLYDRLRKATERGTTAILTVRSQEG